jgi:hypothetical protein
MDHYIDRDYKTIRTDEEIETGNWENLHSHEVERAAVFSTDHSDYNQKYNTMVTLGLFHAIT